MSLRVTPPQPTAPFVTAIVNRECHMGIVSALESVLPTAGSCLSKWRGLVNIASVFPTDLTAPETGRQLGLGAANSPASCS
jgi:hypothetical protein